MVQKAARRGVESVLAPKLVKIGTSGTEMKIGSRAIALTAE